MNTSDHDSDDVIMRCPAWCSFCGNGSVDEESLIEGPDRDIRSLVYLQGLCRTLRGDFRDAQATARYR